MTTSTTEKTTRTPSMKWLRLGEDKDPEFEKHLFLTDGNKFHCGVLEKIEQVQVGKKYSFNLGLYEGATDVIASNMTHYCNPVLPK